MKSTSTTILRIFLFGLVLVPQLVFSYEIESQYANIIYYKESDLRRFNNELYMGRLKSQVAKSETVTGEVIAKINFITEKVMQVLDMFPRDLKYTIVIHENVTDVQLDFKQLYQVEVNYIAFYSPSKNTVFYSANNGNLRVVAHEIGHVVAENYFMISPPQRIHEVMAQYAEMHITD